MNANINLLSKGRDFASPQRRGLALSKAVVLTVLALCSLLLPQSFGQAAAPTATNLSVIEFGRPVFTERAGNPNANILLRRSGDLQAGASVDLLTSNETALAQIDFLPLSNRVVFAPKQAEQTVTIPLLKNPEAKGSRTVQLVLRNPMDARIGALGVAQLVIAERDALQSWITLGLDRVAWLSGTVFDIPFWQYVVSLIYIFLAFYISKLVDYIIRERLKVWTRRTKTELDDMVLNLLRGPLKAIAFVFFLHLGLKIFIWPDWVASFISNTLLVVVAVSISWMLLKLIDLSTAYWKRRAVADEDRTFAEQLLPIVRNSLKVFVLIVAILVTLQNLGLNITSLITSLGIGGLALALAAQDTLANFFGAIVILVDKPFHIGDDVTFDSVTGKIESIGFRSTRVRNLDGHLVSVPNKTIGNATIINITRRPHIRTVINLGLPLDTTAERVQHAIALLTQIFREHPMTHDVTITFDKFTGTAVNIAVIHWWKGEAVKQYAQGIHQLNLAIKKRFDEEKLTFAMPIQTVNVRMTNDQMTND